MKVLVAAALMTVTVLGCATIPQTRVYREAEGTMSDHVCILPVLDSTPERSVTQAALNSLRKDLSTSLEETKRFRSIQLTDKLGPSRATLLQCRITQCDPSARRMSVVVEMRSADSAQPFIRLVAHTELVSIAWPVDYIAVMERAGKAVANDLAKSIVGIYDEGKTISK